MAQLIQPVANGAPAAVATYTKAVYGLNVDGTPGERLDHTLEGMRAALSGKLNTPQEVPGGSDLNNYTTPGMYYCGSGGATVANTPLPASSFSLFVEKTDAYGTGVKQTFTHFANAAGTYIRVCPCDAAGSFGAWALQATAMPPQEYDLPLAEGVSAICAKYSKDQFGTVRVSLIVLSSISADTVIGILPIGFRPSYAVNAAAASRSFDGNAGILYVAVDGVVRIAAPVNIDMLGASGEISFIAV